MTPQERLAAMETRAAMSPQERLAAMEAKAKTQQPPVSQLPPGDLRAVPKAVMAVADNVLPAVTGTVTGALKGGASLATRLLENLSGNRHSDAHTKVKDWLEEYLAGPVRDIPVLGHPVSDAGNALQQGIGEVAAIPGNLTDKGLAKADEATGNSMHLQQKGKEVGELFSDAMSVVPAVGAAKGIAGMKAASTARAVAEAAKEPTVIATLRAGDIKLPPSVAADTKLGGKPGLVADAAESAAGTGPVGQSANTYNIESLQRRIAKDNNLDLTNSHGLFSEKLFADARKAPNKAYDAVEKLPGQPVALESQIDNLSGTLEINPAYIAKLKKDYGIVGTSAEAVQRVRKLRADATKLYHSPDLAMQERGFFARSVADMYDDVLTARAEAAGIPKVIDDLKQARVTLSKLHTIEDSSPAGLLDPQRVLREKERGRPLDEGLGFAAYAAEHAPSVTRHPHLYPGVRVGGTHTTLADAASWVVRKAGVEKGLLGPYQRALGKVEESALTPRFYTPKEPPPAYGGELPWPREMSVAPGGRKVERNFPDERQIGGHPGQPHETLRLPAPGNATPPRATAPDVTSMSAAEARAALSHPGAAPWGDLYKPEMGLEPYSGMAPASGGLPSYEVLRMGPKENVKGRTFSPSQRSLEMDRGRDISSFIKNEGNMSAEERGRALALILEGKASMKDRTMKQLAKAVREAERNK